MACDVAPDVSGLAVVRAVHAVGALVLEGVERLHEVAMLKISTRVLEKSDYRLGDVDDVENRSS